MNEQMLPRHIENQKRLGGRPRVSKEAKRGRRVQIYMDEETYQILQIQCQKTGLSMSSLLLQNAKGIEIKERLPKDFSRYIHLFAGAANNLNQLAHSFGSFTWVLSSEKQNRTTTICHRCSS